MNFHFSLTLVFSVNSDEINIYILEYKDGHICNAQSVRK